MKEQTGVCRFCGQIQMVKAGDGLTEEELDRLATLQCGCDEAIAIQKVEQKKTYAESNIKQLFAEDGKAFVDVMIAAAGSLANKSIKKMTLVNEQGIRATLTAKENTIKIERVITDKSVLED